MKKRVAFIKYCGASAGGTEKYLQTIAANLDKSKFDVDYYFSGPAELIISLKSSVNISIESGSDVTSFNIFLQ